MQKWRQWEAASKADWGLALKREAVIRPLVEERKLNRSRVTWAMESLEVSRSVLYDLVRRYKRRPQTSSLLPWKRGRNTNAQFLDPSREELLRTCIRGAAPGLNKTQNMVRLIADLVLNSSPSSDPRQSRVRFRQSLKLWETLLCTLPRSEGETIEQACLTWPVALRRRFASTLLHQAP